MVSMADPLRCVAGCRCREFFHRQTSPVLIYNAFCVLLFSALALCQFFLEKRGEKGKKLLKRIYIAAIVLCVLILIAALALSLL